MKRQQGRQGRPRKAKQDKRSKKISVRIDAGEHHALLAHALGSKTTAAELVRERVEDLLTIRELRRDNA